MTPLEQSDIRQARLHLTRLDRALAVLNGKPTAEEVDDLLETAQAIFFAIGRFKHHRFAWIYLRPDILIPDRPDTRTSTAETRREI